MYMILSRKEAIIFSSVRGFSGKSLLISTIEAYFEGKKDFFDGLAIAGLEKDWKNILYSIWIWIPGNMSRGTPCCCFLKRILSDGRNATEAVIDRRFAMLTSVTKFGKISVFSDMNNLQDISKDEQYADTCGISKAELSENFSEDIQNLAETNGQSREEACIALKEKYDGYHFNPWTPYGLYNSFSLLNTFAKNCFSSYWFETGTPTSLIRLLKDIKYDLTNIRNSEFSLILCMHRTMSLILCRYYTRAVI